MKFKELLEKTTKGELDVQTKLILLIVPLMEELDLLKSKSSKSIADKQMVNEMGLALVKAIERNAPENFKEAVEKFEHNPLKEQPVDLNAFKATKEQ